MTTPNLPRLATIAFVGLVGLVLLIWLYTALHRPLPAPPTPTPAIDSIRIVPTPGRAADEATIYSIANLPRP